MFAYGERILKLNTMDTNNLKHLNIDQLSMRWKASEKNLELRERIEEELQTRIQSDNYCSREELFDLSVIQKHALTVYFIPTSEAYESYGEYITANILFDEEDKIEMLSNISSDLSTYGQITAKIIELTADDLSQDQIESLEDYGFNTNEILYIQHS